MLGPTVARSRLLLCLLLVWGLGCDLAEDDLYSLRIVSPENDATFTDRDDTDPLADGMQIAVRVESTGDGVPIELLRLVGGEPELIGRVMTREREASFTDVPLRPGANRLQVRDARNGRTSLPITVYFEDPCGTITYLYPQAVPGDMLVLGPAGDADGNGCGDSFALALEAATGLPDGTRVSALVNQVPVASSLTRGGVLRIDRVPLEAGTLGNELSLLVEGKGCTPVRFPAQLWVDCKAPSCEILTFAEDDVITSQADTNPDTPGLDLDFVVSSAIEASGRTVELVINGDQDNALVATAELVGGRSEARFPGVPLPDGSLRVKATCRDAAGASSTALRLLSVDTQGCAVSVTSPPANSSIVAAAHQSTGAVEVNATLGGDCTEVRFGTWPSADCAGLTDLPTEILSVGQTAVTRSVTLSEHGDQYLCVGSVDQHGNPNHAAIAIRFESEAPKLELLEPRGELSVSRVGNTERLSDLDPETRACERPVRVSCDLRGAPVTLVRVPDDVVLSQSTCLAGEAIFESVPFPSENDGSLYQVVARQSAPNGLVGESEPLAVQADCDPPALAFGEYACGVTAISPSADERPDIAGIQHTVRVTNTPNPQPAVSLQLSLRGTPLGAPLTDGVESGPETVFAEVTLAEGVIGLEACATDLAGNAACTASCTLLVGEVPSIEVSQPADDHLVYSLDLSSQGVVYRNGPPLDLDCDPAPGLQIPVEAQVSGAESGRSARVQLRREDGSIVSEKPTSVAPDGSVSACLETVEGSGLTVRIEVDADQSGLYGAAERAVVVDTQPPTAAPSVEADAVACREPSAVHIDTMNSAAADELGFELRCAASEIANEGDWRDARRVSGEPRPHGPTGGLRWQLLGGLPGQTRYCSLRGYDRAGAYTPLGSSLAIESPPLSVREVAVPAELAPVQTRLGQLSLTALGDVNGDGFDDVLLSSGAANTALGGAALYLGSASGLTPTPVVRFESDDSYGLGEAAALGNFDGDAEGLMDFVLAAPGSARLFVVLGRRTWPSTIVSVDAGGCGVDLCVQGDSQEQLGQSLTSARFDSDALPDLVAGADSSAVVILGNALYTAIANLGAHGGGRCLDARTTPGPDACGTGRSAPARGFRLEAPASLDHVLSSEPGRLFLAHAGGTSAPSLWYAHRRSYELVEGLVRVDSAELTLVEQLAQGSWGAANVLGDLDGDGRGELAWSRTTSAGTVQVIAREGTNELRQAFTFTNDAADASGDGFGASIALGAHPELGLLGDIDGDGLADALLGSHETGSQRGSVALFHGEATLPSAPLPRSLQSLAFDDQNLLAEPDLPASDYPRSGHYVGDVDGDGHLDLAVLEPAHRAGAGRFLVLGACAEVAP